ncbi:hypothetical protein CERZMDRAFT_121891 [Cercospora zeae-maydis SCOH1-5]|uniref:DUF7587 domain-containing protein n=1 Tax=Cercospora zeae-maydis SCOH1-5 TaxID=717836 RepID=A0A6A6FA58_9PEZI|nr:hypothetical protein CERZMDRAFT_121891 [Cercospora zeae-maydis SCOH1-5]
MDRLRCSLQELPDYLYRVQYNGCNTEFSDRGLFAADNTTTFDETNIPSFQMSIVNQFTRTNRLPTPFVSVFSEIEHAENWALTMGPNVKLLHLSTALWKDPYIFKLSTLCQRLPVTIPDAASQHIKGAYLCLHSVPFEAVTEVMDREAIESRVDGRKYREYYLPYDPDDSEDEAIENNCNDDAMKMLEGDW